MQLRAQSLEVNRQAVEIQGSNKGARRALWACGQRFTRGNRKALHPRPQSLMVDESNTFRRVEGGQGVRGAARAQQEASRDAKSRPQNSLMRDEDVIEKMGL